MPIQDSLGIYHIVPTEEVTAWGKIHIDQCPRCRNVMGGPPMTIAEWDEYAAAHTKRVFTYDELFINEPGPITCFVCGVRVVYSDTHLEWHNKLGV